MRIYESDSFILNIKTKKEIKKINDNSFLCPNIFELTVCGKVKIVWPNREGEGFDLGDVYPFLQNNGFLKEGISIAWPATAYSQSLLFLNSNVIFFTEDDCGGCYREIRVFAENENKIIFRFTGKPSVWKIKTIKKSCQNKKVNTNKSYSNISYQFQLGMKDPSGVCASKEGFQIIEKLVDRFSKNFRVNSSFSNVLHLFGYADGHDRGYPDYAPAKDLGGIRGLTFASEAVHKKGFLLSCYLNARIAQKESFSKYPELLSERCFYPNGGAVTESYYNRIFYVMNPNSRIWQEHLFKQAMTLKLCGADAIQLDQVAGRAPVVAPGESWGSGYKILIERIQAEGLIVWIQGVSDYYPANWFEMTLRDLKILKEGVLRGGNPFGKTDISLLNESLLAKNESIKAKQRYIVPLSKVESIKKYDLPIIIDLLGSGGLLPVYGKPYLDELNLLEKTKNSVYNS